MELHEAKVDTYNPLVMPWKETRIVPVGDIQFGAEGCDTDRLKRDLERGMKFNAYFLGMGDFVDVFSPSGRSKVKVAEFYDSAVKDLEDIAMQRVEAMLRLLRGTEGRWLGIHEGHHYMDFQTGETSDTLIAKRLGTKFLGTCAITRLVFRRPHSQASSAFEIWSHHGIGSSITMGGPLNKLERCMSRWRTPRAFLIGHYHRAVGYKIDCPKVIWGDVPRLKTESVILACTGGYLKGYTVGSRSNGRPAGSYIEKGMMPPTNLGGIVMFLSPIHSGSRGIDTVEASILA